MTALECLKYRLDEKTELIFVLFLVCLVKILETIQINMSTLGRAQQEQEIMISDTGAAEHGAGGEVD